MMPIFQVRKILRGYNLPNSTELVNSGAHVPNYDAVLGTRTSGSPNYENL